MNIPYSQMRPTMHCNGMFCKYISCGVRILHHTHRKVEAIPGKIACFGALSKGGPPPAPL